jgi:hypothetical protein
VYELYGIPTDVPEPVDREVLQMLVDDFERRPWTIAAVSRATGHDRAVTLAALIRLRRNELIKAADSYILASRPAIYYARIAAFADEPTNLH